MATSVDANARGITDLISAAHMTQSTHVGVNLANHISAERKLTPILVIKQLLICCRRLSRRIWSSNGRFVDFWSRRRQSNY
jgi:hypothetical protein